MLAQASGAPLVNVPYKGVGPAITDLLGGRISAAFVTLVLVKDAVRSGKLKLLAAATEKRVATLPDMPTFGELGFKGIEAALWYGLIAPAKTPREIVLKLNREIGDLGGACGHAHRRTQSACDGVDRPVGTHQAGLIRWRLRLPELCG